MENPIYMFQNEKAIKELQADPAVCERVKAIVERVVDERSKRDENWLSEATEVANELRAVGLLQ